MELLVFTLLSTLAITFPYVSPAHIEPILSQLQESDDSGQYKYSYESGQERKSEYRTPDGTTHGSYSYLDSDGKVQVVKYTAGVQGFQVETLPVEGARRFPDHSDEYTLGHDHGAAVVGETPEVAAARMQHAAAYAAALKMVPKHHAPVHVVPSHQHHFPTHTHHTHLPAVHHFQPSGSLVETPEVAAARMQHAAAHAAALKVLPVTPDHHGHVNHHVSRPVLQHHDHHYRHDQGIVKFAEEVPRSALGETPEVEAAREAHLAFFAKVRSGLPELDN